MNKRVMRGIGYAAMTGGLMMLSYIIGELRAINNCSEAAYEVLKSMDNGLTNVRFEKGGTVMARSYLNDPREEVEED